MKNIVLLTLAMVLVLMGMGSGVYLMARNAPGAALEIVAATKHSVSNEKPAAGIVREVSAYNVGVRAQTDERPCIGATGRDLCRLISKGLKICAANFVEPQTILKIEGYGKCVVLDRMNRRFAHRVDIAMSKDEVDKALEFGVQRRYVEVRPRRP